MSYKVAENTLKLLCYQQHATSTGLCKKHIQLEMNENVDYTK